MRLRRAWTNRVFRYAKAVTDQNKTGSNISLVLISTYTSCEICIFYIKFFNLKYYLAFSFVSFFLFSIILLSSSFLLTVDFDR